MLRRGEFNMANDIMATSNRFFDQIVGPLLEKHHPHIHQKVVFDFKEPEVRLFGVEQLQRPVQR